jgi:hypothetical protein
MRTGNTTDGMYLFLFLIPFIISLLTGDLVRKKILSSIASENIYSKNLSMLAGVSAELLVIAAGVSVGFLLIFLV